ncbi:hypothetical protein V0N16_002797 [Salmonella enterica]|nr:hypothetical protein [Salmonella enterica]
MVTSDIINLFVAIGTCTAVFVALLTKKQSSFESTFSLLLSQHNQSLQDLKKSSEYIDNTRKVIDSAYLSVERNIPNASTSFIEIQNKELHKFDDFYGSYFRILYHLIKYIDNSAGYHPFEMDGKKKYTNLIRANMDSEITYLLAVNCVHAKTDTQYSNYKTLIERYALFEHMIFDMDFFLKYDHPELQNSNQKCIYLLDLEPQQTVFNQIVNEYHETAFGSNPKYMLFK